MSAGSIQRERHCLFDFVLVSHVVILVEYSYVSVAVGLELKSKIELINSLFPLICPQLFSFISYLI